MAARTTTKIMIIRHAEKPPSSDDDATPARKILEGPPFGVDLDGNNSNESLIVRGWQRRRGSRRTLRPANGPPPNPNLATPQFLFASDSKSQRPLETIAPLGEKLGLTPTVSKKGEYKAIADAAMSCGGIALISWQHQDIPEMANHILGNKTTAPAEVARRSFRRGLGVRPRSRVEDVFVHAGAAMPAGRRLGPADRGRLKSHGRDEPPDRKRKSRSD